MPRWERRLPKPAGSSATLSRQTGWTNHSATRATDPEVKTVLLEIAQRGRTFELQLGVEARFSLFATVEARRRFGPIARKQVASVWTSIMRSLPFRSQWRLPAPQSAAGGHLLFAKHWVASRGSLSRDVPAVGQTVADEGVERAEQPSGLHAHQGFAPLARMKGVPVDHYLPLPPKRAGFLVATTCVDRKQRHLDQVNWKFREEPLLLFPAERIRRWQRLDFGRS